MSDSEDQKQVSKNDLRNSQFGGGFINADKVKAQRIGGDIWNIRDIFLGNRDKTESQNLRNPIQQKLLKIVNTEVESRINSSLHNRVYVVLEKEQNPSQVQSPWEMEVKVGSKPKIRLQNTEITTVFDREEIAGRLLILGQPGAGKTTMLLKLAEELIKRADDNHTHPVPVLFSLSAWQKDNQSIKDWLVEQLKDKYGVRKDIGKQWIDNQEIIPLLDGLDEIAVERQELCVRKINDFLHPGTWSNPVVVCSRTEEYQHLATLLQLNNSLELFPFTPQQVYEYLQNTANLQLWDSIKNDADLNQLAQTPLLLNIIVLSAQEISVETWQQFKTDEERHFYLFDAYIRRMLQRRYKGKQPQQEKTKRWLGWLAQRLVEENTTEFLIEKMQPYWLSNKLQIVVYNMVVWGIISGLITGLISGSGGLITGLISRSDWLITGLISGLFYGIIGLIYGLIYGLVIGLIGQLIEKKIEKIIILISPLPGFSKGIVKCLIYGLIGGLIYWLILGLMIRDSIIALIYRLIRWQEVWKLIEGRDFKLIYGLIGGLIGGLIYELIGDNIETIESLKFSLKKTFYGLIIGLITGLIYGVSIGVTTGLNYDYEGITVLIIALIIGLISGLIGGFILGLIFGISGADFENKKFPNQGIHQSIINTFLLSFLGCIFATLLVFGYLIGYLIILNINININEALVGSLVLGLLFGVLIGIIRCGTPAIKHFVLRVILWFNGYIPWNYAKFLNYCTNRLFLQRVGGGYRFIHKMLQDHFAAQHAAKP
ncbi:MAG: NACHT domain-containing protein [Nostocaceae cyanobacterium]|nr:NACHT domain-containing protein [Nostocaceae cyanobacterium]